ncbi:MAG: hypothetical protein UV38_C0001G0307 [candidate division TM6 bacterium GW2011_GWE2_42_60]|nr:MAG: hypothetical protein UV38_C0001G0307 [candidate division TM6 bacterium GW2011_GWE2_42_60]HBY05502.1 hypothetical protein [Candidatus Dependentiae bacterium]
MKKTYNMTVFLAVFLAVWTFQVDARLEKNLASLNINSPSNQQQENNAPQNIGDAQRLYFIQDVRNALLSRWTPIQRARISDTTFPDPVAGSVEISVIMGQNVNVQSFQTNFTNLVTAIVDRLQEIVDGREFELEGLATQNSANGVVFSPIFLQDPFDSEGDEGMPEEESEEPSNATTNTVQNTSVNQNPPVSQQNIGNQTALDSEAENIEFEEEDIDSPVAEDDNTSITAVPER